MEDLLVEMGQRLVARRKQLRLKQDEAVSYTHLTLPTNSRV